MNKPLGKYWYLLIFIFLVSVTFAVYWPVVNHEFVKYDDDKYVTDGAVAYFQKSFTQD